MADRVRKVNYCYTKVPNYAGQGEAALRALREAGVNLLAYSAFPSGGRKAQMDFIPENLSAFRKVARKQGWRLSKVKKGFLITGQERLGAIHRHFAKLSDANINITAADALSAGKGRYGMILLVRPKQYARASRALGAK